MSHVLLVTLWGYSNFGNRLQVIALKRLIEDTGRKVTCAAAEEYEAPKDTIKRNIKEVLGCFGSPKFRNLYLTRERRNKFKRPDRNLLSPIVRINAQYDTGFLKTEEYDAAVTGSDQVWHNWYHDPKELAFFYLSFMPPQKRISYAASFGFDRFPEEDLSYHQKGLNGMRLISCREESGCQLVEQATGKRGKLVLDPTLCVDERIWCQLEKKPGYRVPEHYLLIFILGDEESYADAIHAYAEKEHLEIINLFDTGRRDVWKTGIENFLWLVHHADFVCTDSFHCVCFSILFEQCFTVFHRQQKGYEHMFGRIGTLLQLLHLTENEYQGMEIQKRVIDYQAVKERLLSARRDSVEWLGMALDNVENKQN